MDRIVFEGSAADPMKPGDSDGMALLIEEAEADGFEGEHVWDAGVEDPPHPHWDPVNRRTRAEYADLCGDDFD